MPDQSVVVIVGGALLAACGRVGFAPRSDAIAVDASAPLAFATPVTVAGVSDPVAFDDDPSLTDDLLDIWIGSDRAGGAGMSDIWTAHRNSVAEPFPSPTPESALNLPGLDETPKVSGDGLTIWFGSDRGGTGYILYVATRPTRTSPWSTPIAIPELDSPGQDVGAGPASPLELYFVSDRDGVAAEYDLYVATRGSTSLPYTQITHLIELDTGQEEITPFPFGSSFLYFTSNRTGDRDIYLTTRPVVAGAPVIPLDLNTPAAEEDPWLSADGRKMFFASTRNGTYDIFEADAL